MDEEVAGSAGESGNNDGNTNAKTVNNDDNDDDAAANDDSNASDLFDNEEPRSPALQTAINKFFAFSEKHYNINFDQQLNGKSGDDDEAVIRDACNELCKIMPRITTDLWAKGADKEVDKALDAELKQLYHEEEIDEANQDLADNLEEEGDKALDSYIDKKANKEVDKRIANRKKTARKNFSDGPKNQGSMSGENGQ